MGEGIEPAGGGASAWLGWAGGVVAVYGALFGVGRLLLGPRWEAAPFLVASVVGFVVVARSAGEKTAR
jgi:hypothetical protein